MGNEPKLTQWARAIHAGCGCLQREGMSRRSAAHRIVSGTRFRVYTKAARQKATRLIALYMLEILTDIPDVLLAVRYCFRAKTG